MEQLSRNRAGHDSELGIRVLLVQMIKNAARQYGIAETVMGDKQYVHYLPFVDTDMDFSTGLAISTVSEAS